METEAVKVAAMATATATAVAAARALAGPMERAAGNQATATL